MTGRAAQLAALAALAARRVEMLEAAVAAADVAAARAPNVGRPATRFRARDTRRDDAAHARAVASAGLESARRVEAAVAVALGLALEELERPEAAERMTLGKVSLGSESSTGKVYDRVGEAVGLSGRTYSRVSEGKFPSLVGAGRRG